MANTPIFLILLFFLIQTGRAAFLPQKQLLFCAKDSENLSNQTLEILNDSKVVCLVRQISPLQVKECADLSKALLFNDSCLIYITSREMKTNDWYINYGAEGRGYSITARTADLIPNITFVLTLLSRNNVSSTPAVTPTLHMTNQTNKRGSISRWQRSLIAGAGVVPVIIVICICQFCKSLAKQSSSDSPISNSEDFQQEEQTNVYISCMA